ncbi:RNA-directed DNA polymerase from mobile element jockey-like [Brachionus plicatilis]|uniref:RNA-directed DNA polymerase from mobile element jockey-like n=1 Tax=Brachionus plicatilis TaxID=10195 RepID=A0A3M7RQM7_BRAPC|nr:RNA-directed DNA polymerase from mobile element jockey-like [Brachionus plicatilis]
MILVEAHETSDELLEADDESEIEFSSISIFKIKKIYYSNVNILTKPESNHGALSNEKEEKQRNVNLINEENERDNKALRIENDKFEGEVNNNDKTNFNKININREFVHKVIKKLPNGKARGFNDVSNELYKYGSTRSLIELTAILMEKIINIGFIPTLFNVGKILPIIKDEEKSKTDVNNVRPITISDTLANIYEKIILNEIDKTHSGKGPQINSVLKVTHLVAMQYLQ